MAEELLVSLAAIAVIGFLTQWLAWRLEIPAILLMLAGGFIAGPVTGWLDPDVLFGELLTPIVSLSVAIILFEGGLSLRAREIADVGRVVGALVIAGMFVTWVIGSLTAAWLLGLDLRVAVLLGAVLVVSGPTVIIPLLRHVRPKGAIGPILKWEGIVIDPIGAILAVLVFEAIIHPGAGAAFTAVVLSLGRAVLVAGVLAAAGAWFLIQVLRRHWAPDYLQNPVALMLVLAGFAASNVVQPESGLLTVTVMGVIMANQRSAPIHHVTEFKETLRVLLIPALFIILAARLDISDLDLIGWPALAFVAVLILVARPLAVLVSTHRSELSLRERGFLAAVMPRGIVAAAVSAIFALDLARLGVDGADLLVPYTFLVIIATVVFSSVTAGPLARVLGVASGPARGLLIAGAHEWARRLGSLLQDAGVRVLLVDTNRNNVMQAWDEGLPAQHADILAEHVEDDLDLEGIGKFLAMTPNPEVNSLAALHFAQVFDRSDVFQLAAPERDPERGREIPQHLRGRELFASDATFPEIARRLRAGARFEADEVDETMAARTIEAMRDQGFLPLVLVRAGGAVRVYGAGATPQPERGDTLISLVDPAGRDRLGPAPAH